MRNLAFFGLRTYQPWPLNPDAAPSAPQRIR